MRIVLDNNAKVPTRAHALDAGYDLYSRERKIVYPSCAYSFDTGVHVEIPEGHAGMIKSKSGLNIKHDLVCEGVIDSGYTGSIVVKLHNLGYRNYTVEQGDKIAQLVIMPILTPEIEVADELEVTERGSNGFGSTGR